MFRDHGKKTRKFTRRSSWKVSRRGLVAEASAPLAGLGLKIFNPATNPQTFPCAARMRTEKDWEIWLLVL